MSMKMMKTVIFTIIICFLAVTIPVSYGAGACDGLSKQECCGKKDTNNTNLCQYINCTGKEECKPIDVEQTCVNVTANNTCPSPGPTTPTTATTQKNETTTQAPPTTQKNVTTQNPVSVSTQTQDPCFNKTQTECCNVKDDKNVTVCQFATCEGQTGGACYNKSKTDVCAGTPGTDVCITSTPAPNTTITTKKTSPAPTQPPKCEDNTDNTTCCKAIISNVPCQWVNCTDKSDQTKIHTGCHLQGQNLSSVCVGTVTDLCKPATSTPIPSTSSPKPTGGAQPSTGGGENEGRHFDGPSFIGGIVLCAGIVAIVFFGFKFYKARTERNYHTLH